VTGSIDELSDLIARLQLAELGDLRACREELSANSSEQEFLDLLQRKHLLTGFQVEKLARRDTDGLVLGGAKLLYRISAGSFARVYRGSSLADDSPVGIKVLRDRWASDPETVKLFHREGEIGRRLKHPNIVPIYAVAQEGTYHYITMEFVEGGNLRDFLKIRGKLEPAEACRYGVNMADALEYALSQGMSHRDLKLTNVLMSSQGTAKLIDFGLAADDHVLNRKDGPDLQQALEYSTLEKGCGGPRNDPRSDLYFLGTILYELLTGAPPYPRTKDREERKRFSRYRDVRPVTAIEPRLPHSVADIVDRLLHTNPQLRYQRPAEVAADLRRTMAGLAPTTAASPKGSGRAVSSEPPRILCVESRPKQQDILRDYLSKRGYRVLLLSDAERAIARIAQQPPDCLVLMGQAVEDVSDAFERAVASDHSHSMGALLVLSEKQAAEFNGRQRVRVVRQPIALRGLRNEIESLLKELGKPVPATADDGEQD
jgi:serine/threonine protein kinase